jgi:hypothetical protein
MFTKSEVFNSIKSAEAADKGSSCCSFSNRAAECFGMSSKRRFPVLGRFHLGKQPLDDI